MGDRQTSKGRSGGFSRRAIARLGGVGSVLLISPGLAAASPTPAQVEGPFYPVEPGNDTDLDLTRVNGHSNSATGETILVRGRVLAEDGQALAGATVDVWQANHHGRYSHPEDPNTAPLDPDFQGQGVVRTDPAGGYGLKTIKPGAYPLAPLGGTGWRCRHIHFKVSRPGFKPLTTQMYFRGDPLIGQDEEIVKAPEALREMLIADVEIDEPTGLPLYRFDVVLANV